MKITLQIRSIGLMLGLMAWCMQLVVFVQPFLPGQSMPGIGVCQVIVEAFSQPTVNAIQNHAVQNHTAQNNAAQNNAGQNLSGHAFHRINNSAVTPFLQRAQGLVSGQDSVKHYLNDQNLKSHLKDHHDVAQSVALNSSQPPVVDHHFSHLSCGFCMMYGHAIPPPEAPSLQAQQALDIYSAPSQLFNYNASIIAADYLTPNTRAPPLLVLV